MSKDTERYTNYTEFIEADALSELPPEDQELAEKIQKRRKRSRRGNKRRKFLMVSGTILLFAVLLTMCGREIVRLKAENLSLRRQHAQLEEERDRLQKELENVGNKEYIKDQARKQLRLLDPGELVFIFDDGTGNTDTDSDTEQPETADTPPDALDMAEIISSGVDQAALTGQSAANAGVDEYEYEYGED
ncbi:MAG: septum formation initiator family protein [Mogibacterium sp.]|nr:septum formation initiator family protein [Mogibacterium sp.]